MLGKVVAPLIAGETAVLLFFMISGFYMAMILNEKYTSNFKFYASRVLRLYPIYFLIFAATCALVLHSKPTTNFEAAMYSDLPVWHKSLLLISNISIFGLDFLPFLGIGHAMINVLPPAWSLGVEIGFYAVAPFLVRRSIKTLTVVVVATLLIRASFWQEQVTWRYFFAPAVWCFFILGSLSYRLWHLASDDIKKRIGIAALLGLPILGYFCALQVPKDFDNPLFWLFYLCFAAALPPIFRVTKFSKADALIGDLSYPIYLVHLPFLTIFNQGTILKNIIFIVAISIVLLLMVFPIEILRKKLGSRSRHLAPAQSSGIVAPSVA